MKALAGRVKKILIILSITIILIFAIIHGISRILFASASHYRDEIVHLVSLALEKPVQIKSVHATWHGLQPVLKCRNVTVYQDENCTHQIAQIDRLLISVDPISSYLKKKWMPGELKLSGVNLTLSENNIEHNEKNTLSLLTQLMSPGAKSLQNVNLALTLADGQLLQLEDINAVIKNSKKQHNIRMIANVGGDKSKIQIIADLQGSYVDPQLLTGKVYIKSEHIPISKIRSWLPKQLKDAKGQVSGELWLTLNQNYQWEIQIIKCQFENIALGADDKLPKINHLNGKMLWTTAYGRVDFSGTDVLVTDDHWLKLPIKISHLSNSILWENHNDNVIISMPDWQVEFEHGQFSGTTSLEWDKANGKATSCIDTVADFNISDLALLRAYLPSKVMNPKLVKWLDEAIVSGSIHNGHLIIRGPLADFPAFDRSSGRFIVSADIQDMKLNYAPKWPLLEQVDGQLNFDNRSLSLTSYHAIAYGQELDKLSAVIEDLANPELKFNLRLRNGEFSKALAFIHHSPLEEDLGEELAPMSLTGRMDLDLQLHWLLKENKQAIQTSGSVAMHDAKLTLVDRGIEINHLQGAFDFTQRGLHSEPISGSLFGMPFNMQLQTVHPVEDQFSHTKVNLHGELSDQFFDLEKIVQGKTQYEGELTLFRKQDSRNDILRLYSDLQGISIKLPEPLATTSDLGASVEVLATLNKNAPLDVAIQFADKVKVKATVDGKQVERAAVHFGAGKAVLPKQNGLSIDGEIEQLDLSEWAKVLMGNTSNTRQLQLPSLKKLDVQVVHLNVFEQVLSFVKLSWQRNKREQVVSVRSQTTNGDIIIPADYPHNAMSATFDRLHFRKTSKSEHSELRPSDLPALNIVVNDFSFEELPLGRFQLSITPEGNTLRINELSFKSRLMSCSVSGQWREFRNHHQTSLSGAMYTHNLGMMLNVYDFTGNMIGGDGRALFNLAWDDSLLNYDVKKLNGKVSFQFEDGQIVKLSAQAATQLGLGRILNLFSLQTLPRRLNLDFSDLTKEGFLFDILSGQFVLREGNAFTKNAQMKGSVAQVNMRGRLGLRDKDYQLELAITPHVTASLPVVATVAGGPIAGVATWVAEKVFRRAVNQVTSVYYQVNGSWEHPLISKA